MRSSPGSVRYLRRNPLTWEIEPQTEVKHKLLTEYLGRWFPILAQRRDRGAKILYIDGFAGAGRYSGGELGSPLLALDLAMNHPRLPALLAKPEFRMRFVFIEANHRNFENLKLELSKYVATHPLPSSLVVDEPILGEFADQMGRLTNLLAEQQRRLEPAFVFIDPFGPMGFPLTTVARVMRNPRCEVLIRFNYTRLANTFLPREDMENNLDALYGCRDWRSIRALKGHLRESRLVGLYLDQLITAGNASLVQPFKTSDEHGRVAYFIFGTNNAIGLEEMKEAMWKIDPQGSFRWSATKSQPRDQLSFLPLLAHEECQRQLADVLERDFSGKRIQVRELEGYVRKLRDYVEKHLRPALTLLENRGGIVKVERIEGLRRTGQFPSDCWVEFA